MFREQYNAKNNFLTFDFMKKILLGAFIGALVASISTVFAMGDFFKDDNEIPDWARDPIYNLKLNGFITGYDDDTYRPNQAVTRAELAVILDRVIESLGK